MSKHNTDQDTLTDQPDSEIEFDYRTLKTIATALAPITDTATLTVTLSSIHATAADLANVIAVDTGTHTVDANAPIELTVDTEVLLDAVEQYVPSDDTATITVQDKETAALLDDYYYAEIPLYPEETTYEPELFEKVDAGRRLIERPTRGESQ